MFISKHGRRQAGDTIVEVLVAIGVTSLVLVGAYSSVNHNTLSTQDAQEHGFALKLAQTQLEFLRAAGTSTSLCFNSVGTSVNGPNCVFSNTGAPNCTVEPCYHVGISRPSSSAAFMVDVKWSTLLTSSGANVTLFYRPEVMP